MPRVLIVNSNNEDYLADGLLHGLADAARRQAVDFPKAEYMYDSDPPEVRSRVRGGAFTLYGLLEDMPLARDHMLARALDARVRPRRLRRHLAKLRAVDRVGSTAASRRRADRGRRRRRSRRALSLLGPVVARAGWWFLPRAHNRAIYFKREITPWTRWFASYLALPPPLGRRLGLRPTSLSIPRREDRRAAPGKSKDFPRHIVDGELAGRLGGRAPTPFRRSRLLRGSASVALRHHDKARGLGRAAPLRDRRLRCRALLPRPGPQAGDAARRSDSVRTNSISYHGADELLERVAELGDEEYAGCRPARLLGRARIPRSRAP